MDFTKRNNTLIKLFLIEYLLVLFTQAKTNAEPTSAAIADKELFDISQQLWDVDRDRLPVQLNVQGKAAGKTKDNAPQPLCTNIPQEVYTTPIYKTFIALFDNYNRNDAKPEELTRAKIAEVDNYLSEVMKSGPMCILHEFLSSKGLVPANPVNFQVSIKNIWFTVYKRSKALSSSGIEHVQIGEVKGNEVSGFHNWVRFCMLEKSGNINYMGHTRILQLGGGSVIGVSMSWDQYPKPVSGFFVGTSPAFDLAVYTLCFYARPNKNCKLLINGHNVNIQTHTIQYDGETLVGSAYPDI